MRRCRSRTRRAVAPLSRSAWRWCNEPRPGRRRRSADPQDPRDQPTRAATTSTSPVPARTRCRSRPATILTSSYSTSGCPASTDSTWSVACAAGHRCRSSCCRPGTQSAKVEALGLGADDYLTKPFGMDELARLRASVAGPWCPKARGSPRGLHHRLRRQAGPRRRRGRAPHADAVAHRRGPCPQQRPPRDLRAGPARGWGPTYGKETNYLRVFMTQIRHKLEPVPWTRYSSPNPGSGSGSRYTTNDERAPPEVDG